MRLDEINNQKHIVRDLFQFLKNYADNAAQKGNVLTWGKEHQITINPDGTIEHVKGRGRPTTHRNEREFRRAFNYIH